MHIFSWLSSATKITFAHCDTYVRRPRLPAAFSPNKEPSLAQIVFYEWREPSRMSHRM